MGWLFRPSTLFLTSLAVLIGVAAIVVWPENLGYRAAPLPVRVGEQEIVWLYPATNFAAWERFVTAAQRGVGQQDASLGLTLDDSGAFPEQTTSVPEIVVASRQERLRIRWYKLTSDHKTEEWVRDLLSRKPPPLAIIGGDASDAAIDVARRLHEESKRQGLGGSAPLFLITSATADDAGPGEGPLSDLYPGRTFRFCFTNRRMANVVMDFIWGQEDLRPDSAPVYLTFWEDDPYSVDLNRRFCDALPLAPPVAAVRDWASASSFILGGVLPIDLAGAWWGQFRAVTPESAHISYSVGTFADPNRWEEEEAIRLMEIKLERHPEQSRPLLILPAATDPTRRFLRALVRTAPVEARRFVVATGDSITFNTIYRDRNLAWPVQDLPFQAVFFFHRNPVDPAADFPLSTAAVEGTDHDAAAAGTEDLLLYQDILDALLQAGYQPGYSGLPNNADDLRGRLRNARWRTSASRLQVMSTGDEPSFFDADGNRRPGTGEHIVYLRPSIRGSAVLPEATITVWSWQAQATAEHGHWRPKATVPVHYEGYVGPETMP
jgi:hypothetical protein